MTLFEGSVCSPLCSTTRLSMAAERARLLLSVAFCYLLLPGAESRSSAVTNSYLLLHPVHKLLPGAIFEGSHAAPAPNPPRGSRVIGSADAKHRFFLLDSDTDRGARRFRVCGTGDPSRIVRDA
jgi:hypothetical protein